MTGGAGGGFDRRADQTPPRFDGVAHTFEELVQKQRAADAAHATVEDLRETYGPPAERGMTGAQSGTYETALRAWRDLARDVQAALSEYAKETGRPRADIEAEVERAAADQSQRPPAG